MTTARNQLMPTDQSAYIHVSSKCIRGTWICGIDPQTQQSYEHRAQWMLQRLSLLSGIFSIDVVTYAIMSQHYHLVLHINAKLAKTWSNEEVIRRWDELYPKRPKHPPNDETVSEWRAHLSDVSWFMKSISEWFSRKANKEDQSSGHFWEARFHSQLLLDKAALIACMTFVDLQPIISVSGDRLEKKHYTGLKARTENKLDSMLTQRLWPFDATSPQQEADFETTYIEMAFEDYQSLLSYTASMLHRDQQGALPKPILALMRTLGLAAENWVENIIHFDTRFHNAIGRPDRLRLLAKQLNKKSVRGQRAAEIFYAQDETNRGM